MRSFLAIVISSIYFAFSVGLSIHVHQCNDTNVRINDFVADGLVPIEDDCHAESAHACCSDEKEDACCSKPETKDDCCVDAHLLIHLDEEQLISKNQVLSFVFLDNKSDLTDILLSNIEAPQVNHNYIHPPPTKEDRYIRFCSLTFYG